MKGVVTIESKYKSLIKDTLIFALGNIGSKCILFLMVPLYTNFMSKGDYGIADLVFSIAQFIIPVISLVIFDAVVRFALSKEERREDVIFIGFIVVACSAILAFIITPVVGMYGPVNEWKWYLCVYMILSITNSVELNYLKAKDMNKVYAVLSIIQTLSMASLNVLFLVYMKIGIKGYLLAYIISNLIVDVLAFGLGNIGNDLRKAQFNRTLLKSMVVYSAPLILNNVSWWAIHSSNKVMIEYYIGAVALGVYTVSAKIPALINVIVTVFQQAWGLSSVKEIESSNDTKFYSEVFYYYTMVTSGVCMMLVSIMKIFMFFYVSESYRDAWIYVPLLLVSAVFSAVSSYFGSLYGALKKSVNNMITTAIAALTNVIANLILIPIIGVWGAVYATLISYVVIAFLRLFDVKRFLHIDIPWKLFLGNCLIILLQALIISFGYNYIITSIVAVIIFIYLNQNGLFALIRKKRLVK